MDENTKAVVLLSGGLDSCTALAIARSHGFQCHALTVLYGQQHAIELEAAKCVAQACNVAQHKIFPLDLRPLVVSALTSEEVAVPMDRTLEQIGARGEIPSTYVPARNTVFLSLALAWAESLAASDIFIGVNVLDASGYPDCRPAFIQSFEKLANLATGAGVTGRSQYRIHTPLIEWTKAEIIQHGIQLGIDYSVTHSCYSPIQRKACGRCDACILRRKGFREANISDPTRYHGSMQ